MGMKNGKCTICPQGCRWQEHKNLPYIIVYDTKQVKRDAKEMKAEFERSTKERFTLENYLKDRVTAFDQKQRHAIAMLDQMRGCKVKLCEIALRPNPMTSTEHVEQLIRAEEQEARPGWQARVKQLRNILQKWTAVNDVEAHTNPVQKVLDQYLQESDEYERKLITQQGKLETRMDEEQTRQHLEKKRRDEQIAEYRRIAQVHARQEERELIEWQRAERSAQADDYQRERKKKGGFLSWWQWSQ